MTPAPAFALGRQHSAASRDADGLPPHPTDVTTLRALDTLLDAVEQRRQEHVARTSSRVAGAKRVAPRRGPGVADASAQAAGRAAATGTP